jgi:hypothetical protein
MLLSENALSNSGNTRAKMIMSDGLFWDLFRATAEQTLLTEKGFSMSAL